MVSEGVSNIEAYAVVKLQYRELQSYYRGNESERCDAISL